MYYVFYVILFYMFKDITTRNNEGTTSLKIYGYSRYQFKVQDVREICRFF